MQELREVFEKILAHYQEVDHGIQKVVLAPGQKYFLLQDSTLVVDYDIWQNYLSGWELFFHKRYPQLANSWREIFLRFSLMSPQHLWTAENLDQNEAWVWNILFHPVFRQQSILLANEIEQDIETSYCPVCGQPPLLAIANHDQNTRQLVCGKCTTKWQFTMLCCPQCHNSDHDTLVYRQAEELPGWRVDVCQVCGYKLRLKDLSQESDIRQEKGLRQEKEAHPWILDSESIYLNFI